MRVIVTTKQLQFIKVDLNVYPIMTTVDGKVLWTVFTLHFGNKQTATSC